ncbi:electron transport complex subunit RsxG [uncultured Neptuniibacter sp.]|uniref:electron transport complex subunit RsxG n=1 Tax=unclassified Neptuniibacter TaxID=2630693 RepID=UPI0032B2ED79|tara:strand:+ start:14425 stop:15096 length:672 start_codon:yes stop_codon:yes gene_type:complete
MMQLFSAIKSSTLAISLFAVVCAGVIAVTQVTTIDKITANEREFKAKALYEIVPRESIDNQLLEDTFEIQIAELGHHQPVMAYRAKKDGLVKAVILPVTAPDGYSGNINLIVGINANASVAGVRVLAHKETPGLGDKIETKKSNWIMSFNGQSKNTGKGPSWADKSWAVKKDGGQFDQFTGATITPRAVVNAVGRALDYFAANRAELLQLKPETKQPSTEVTQ